MNKTHSREVHIHTRLYFVQGVNRNRVELCQRDPRQTSRLYTYEAASVSANAAEYKVTLITVNTNN